MLSKINNFDLKKSQRDQDRGVIFGGSRSSLFDQDQNQYQYFPELTFYLFSKARQKVSDPGVTALRAR